MYNNLATNTFTTDDWVKVSAGGTVLNPYPTVQNATVPATTFDSSPLNEQTTPKGEVIPVPTRETFIGDLKKASRRTATK